jgi:DNA polymerase-3 subunit chi
VTKVIFYTGVFDKFDWLARTAEKILARKKTACILVNEIDRSQVSAKLWSFTDTSFIGISEGSRGNVFGELVLGIPKGLEDRNICINFRDEVPSTFSSFEHLIEFAPSEEKDRCAARKRYKWYRERGYLIQTVKT